MNELPLDDLQSIGLTELNSGVSLLTRKDRKYLVPLALARRLVQENDLQVLEIDGRRTASTRPRSLVPPWWQMAAELPGQTNVPRSGREARCRVRGGGWVP